MSMIEWAKREIEIAQKRERGDTPDGRIEYSSVEQCYCEDVNTGSTYTSGLESKIIRELYPIAMPGDRIKVVTEECLTYKKNGDFDTKAIFYCIKDGEKVEINRFFAEAQDYPDRKEVSVGHGWVEITYEEYVGRKVIAEALRKEIRLKQCEMNCIAFENCSYKEEHSENYDWECEKFVSIDNHDNEIDVIENGVSKANKIWISVENYKALKNRELILEAKGQSPVLVAPVDDVVGMEVSENEN